MAFTFTTDQLNTITMLRSEADSDLRPYSDVYKAIFFYMSEFTRPDADWSNITDQEIMDDAVFDPAISQEERSTWLWLRGAYQANSNDGGFTSNFIRDYSSRQFELRYGRPLTESELQNASDEVADNFALDILDPVNAGTLPTIDEVAEIDGGLGVAPVFNGQLNAGLDYTGNYSPWSGSVLFSFLGTGMPLREYILQNDRVLSNGTTYFKALDGTYDLISAAQASWDVTDLFDAWWNSGELDETITLNKLGKEGSLSLLATLREQGNDFFQNYYGLPNEERYQIGGDLPLYGEGTTLGVLSNPFDGVEFLVRPNYIVGLLTDDNISITNNESAGDDIVNLGLGDDYALLGSLGNDLIDGAEGSDTVDYLKNNQGLIVKINALSQSHEARYIGEVEKYKGVELAFTDLLYNVEKITGSADADKFNIEIMKDGITLDGSADNDKLSVLAWDKVSQFDVLNGLLTSTSLTMNFKNFEIFEGSNQNDIFIDASGRHTYLGQGGVDTLDYTAHDADEIANGLSGLGIKIEADLANGVVERSLISGGQKEVDFITDVEAVIGASGDDVFKGKAGVMGQSFTGNGETTERGDKVDFSDFSIANGGVTVDLGTGNGTDSDGGTYSFAGLEQVIGSNAADNITGDGNANWLFGNGGIDAINGGEGNDRIIGGAGSDILEGGGGNDTFYISGNGQQPLWFQSGSDTITDSSGTDSIYFLGGYQFNPGAISTSGSTLFVQGAATVTNSTDIEFVEYSDGAKFSEARLSALIGDATGGTLNGSILEGDSQNNNLTGGIGITVRGLGGNDWLYSNSDTTILEGGDGEDYLYGPGTLDGGSGNDYLDGELNSNVIYKVSGGIDVIRDIGSGGVLQGAGAYTLWKADNGSLVIDLNASTDPESVITSTHKVIVLNHFNGTPLEFIGASAVPTSGVTLLPTELDDVLAGTSGDDSFSASKGEDILDGGTGANTYRFTPTDTGSSRITTVPDAAVDTLVFDSLTQNDVSVIRDASIGTNNLLFSYSQSFTILENALIDETSANHYNVQFGAATPIAFASLDLTTRGSYMADILYGDVPGFSVDDLIFGGAGDDIIDGGDGNDLLYGEEGNDTIETGNGSDIIFDDVGDDIYTVGKGDRVILKSGLDSIGFGTFDAAAGDTSTVFTVELPDNIDVSDTFLRRDETGTIWLDYGAHSVALAATLNPIIDFANDPDLVPEQMVLTTFGSDNGENIIDALYGYFDSSNIFHISAQQDDIIYANGGDDDIVLTGGSDIVYGGDGNDVIGSLINPQNEFPVTGYMKFYGEGGNDLLGLTDFNGELYGGDGNDELIGNNQANILDGGEGHDFISGQGGDNTINGGGGNDLIIGLLNGVVTVDAGAGNDLVVFHNVADDFVDGGEGLDIASFEDMVGFTGSQINLDSQTALINGTNFTFSNFEGAIGAQGDDTIIGTSGNNILDGGFGFAGFFAGNDTLRGEGGDDIYFFGTAFGSRLPPSQSSSTTPLPPVVGDDIIDDASGSSDSIEFSDYFTLADLSFSMSGNDMVISFTDGSVTILNQTGGGKIENLILGDGSVLNLDDFDNWIVGTPGEDTLSAFDDNQSVYGADSNDILNAFSTGSALAGGFGDDTLNGNAGNDILGGGAGNDIISGGAGDDIYLFSAGDGLDTISDTSGFDILSILGGINLSDLTFSQIGDDLQIDIASGVTITDFYSGNADNWLEEIHFSDGSIFDLTSLVAPIAQDDDFIVDQDMSVISNVLADNGHGTDSDPDGGVLSVIAGSFATTNGSVTILSNGDFTYTPDAGYFGSDSFDYTLEDGQGGSDIGTVNITLNFVAPSNTSPIAVDDDFIANQNTNISGNLLVDNGNGVDSDADGDALGVIAGNFAATNGSVTILSNGDFTYTPNAGYFGLDSFDYTLEDGQGGSDTGTANLTINAVPILGKDYPTIDEDTVLTFNPLANDYDPDGDTLTVYNLAGSTYGTSVINPDSTITYTPDPDFFGQDTIYYSVTDNKGGYATQRITVTINPVEDEVEPNLDPVLQKDSATVDEDGSVIINVLANDYDPNEGDVLYVTGVTNGAAVINSDNTVTYTPEANFYGAESFLYYVSDGKGGTAVQRINVTINPVADTTADIEGTDRADTIDGTSASESIAALANNDTIYAGDGDDVLYGNAGGNFLYGEGGADTFIFENATAFDVPDYIEDFDASEGDKIDISDLLSAYDPVSDMLTDFVEITDNTVDSFLAVDVDGGGDNFVQIATISAVLNITDVDALETSGNLVTV